MILMLSQVRHIPNAGQYIFEIVYAAYWKALPWPFSSRAKDDSSIICCHLSRFSYSYSGRVIVYGCLALLYGVIVVSLSCD
jgi:hypothetical protein